MEENLIAAIELGSSAISGIVGQRFANGAMKVLAYVSLPSESSIRHGVVYNTEKAASIIAEVIEKLKKASVCDINMLYVTHNGKSLSSSKTSVERVFDESKIVDDLDILNMQQECEAIPLENKSRLFMYPQEFTLDNKSITEKDPIGVSCKTIRGDYLSVVMNSNLTDDVERTFVRASVSVADSFLSIINVADYLLSADDRQQGCALVDFGADTTTLSIYKNGVLKYLRVLPIGSSLITSDLATVLKIPYPEAEKLKTTYGLASLNSSQDLNETVMVNSRKITIKEISAIIEARNEEILRNLDAHIKNSDLGELLYAGIVVIGGGSNLRNLSKAIQKSVINGDRVRFVREPANSVEWVEPKWKKSDASQLSLLSMLAIDGENCCERMIFDEIDHLSPIEESKVQQQSLFTDDGESVQELKDKLEAEKRAAEAQLRQNAAEDISEEAEQQPAKKTKTAGYSRVFGRMKNFMERIVDSTEGFFDADDDAEDENNTNDTNQ